MYEKHQSEVVNFTGEGGGVRTIIPLLFKLVFNSLRVCSENKVVHLMNEIQGENK